jgi:hypothetical protein
MVDERETRMVVRKVARCSVGCGGIGKAQRGYLGERSSEIQDDDVTKYIYRRERANYQTLFGQAVI